MSDSEATARRRRAALSAVRFSAKVARAVCRRVAAGETQLSISADPAMPSRVTLWRWAKEIPPFARALARAKAVGGRVGGGPGGKYCEATAAEIYDRLCEGESILAICRDPAMPSFSTVYAWRRARPEFAELMTRAREVQAERFFALGWEIAEAVTPETAHATRVKLTQLRWTAGRLAPAKYGATRAVEPDMPPEPPVTIVQRSFRLQTRADGAQRVVGSWPCPDTGLPIAEPRGPWSLPMSAEQAQQKLAQARAEGRPVLGLEDPAAAVDEDG